MSKLLSEVKNALRNERYTMRSFAKHYGFNIRTVNATLHRTTQQDVPPKGVVGKKILTKIKEVTGYDLLSKLGGGNA